MEWLIGAACVGFFLWFARDWIGDWLYARRRKQETVAWIEQHQTLHAALPVTEGQWSAQGNRVCPHCQYELSAIEMIEQHARRAGPFGLLVMQCPRCQQPFK